MIKEFRVLGNSSLFKEVLPVSSKVELMNRSNSSLFAKYRLTESQLALIDYLRGRTARERRKEARQKRFKEAKSLRLFLKDQNIVYVKSSKEKNNFVKIKLIHDAYLEKKPYDKIQKEYLEKLRLRTRD